MVCRYQTFRPDKFDEFMKADSRGVALFELYKPGTPEYGEFFEETLGPDLLAMAKGKLEEGRRSFEAYSELIIALNLRSKAGQLPKIRLVYVL